MPRSYPTFPGAWHRMGEGTKGWRLPTSPLCILVWSKSFQRPVARGTDFHFPVAKERFDLSPGQGAARSGIPVDQVVVGRGRGHDHDRRDCPPARPTKSVQGGLHHRGVEDRPIASLVSGVSVPVEPGLRQRRSFDEGGDRFDGSGHLRPRTTQEAFAARASITGSDKSPEKSTHDPVGASEPARVDSTPFHFPNASAPASATRKSHWPAS